MTTAQMRELARGAIERHLGDVVEEGDEGDVIYDHAFTLAHDALLEAGVDHQIATKVASYAAHAKTQDNSETNLVTACHRCNTSRGTRERGEV